MQHNEAKAFFDREWLEYLRHLSEGVGYSLEVLVLRGHILIERQLTQLVAALLPNPGALDLEKMHFGSKTRLAEALCGHQVHPWVWDALRSVNSMRNSLAHKLEDDQFAVHTQRFISEIQFDDPWTFHAAAGPELESQVAYSLAWLHERLLNECINRK